MSSKLIVGGILLGGVGLILWRMGRSGSALVDAGVISRDTGEIVDTIPKGDMTQSPVDQIDPTSTSIAIGRDPDQIRDMTHDEYRHPVATASSGAVAAAAASGAPVVVSDGTTQTTVSLVAGNPVTTVEPAVTARLDQSPAGDVGYYSPTGYVSFDAWLSAHYPGGTEGLTDRDMDALVRHAGLI